MLNRTCRWKAWPWLRAALLATATPLVAAAAPAVEAKSEAGRALIRAASAEPVDVALAATRLSLGTERVPSQSINTDKRVVFRLPAAYVVEWRGRSNSSIDAWGWLTIRFWSRTLDPVASDELADLFSCPEGQLSPCRAPDSEGERVAARRRAGEYPVLARITDDVGTEAHRRYALAYAAGSAGPAGGRGEGREPCEARWDDALGMVVSRSPEGHPPFPACNLAPYPATWNGRTRTPATFLKQESDGTPRFAVSCPDLGGRADPDKPLWSCRLFGFVGPWPLHVYVQSDRAGDWSNTFDRLRDFLARHTVARTD